MRYHRSKRFWSLAASTLILAIGAMLIGLDTSASDTVNEAEIRANAQRLVWASTLPGAAAEGILHVAAVRRFEFKGVTGSHEIEVWIDDANHRSLQLITDPQGAFGGGVLVLGNQGFTLLPGGEVIAIETIDEFDPYLLGPKASLWAYRSYYDTDEFHIIEGEPGGSASIRFSGEDPSHPGVRFEATLDPTTLLLTQLTTWSSEGKRTMDVEYQLIEVVSLDQLPSGVFDPPVPNKIIEWNTFLTPLEAEALDFDVHYIGHVHGDHALQSILHYESSADSEFYATPRRGVWATYQPPGLLPGERLIQIHSQPVHTDDVDEHPLLGKSSSGDRTTISSWINGTRVTIHASSVLDTQGVVNALRVITGGE
ncbi:hypothetical protein F4Y93_00655 [Candidatus Poribacteria bacterium]|nr:hypothetical protein [Candidatus Poribacteria bacterium]